MKLVKLLLPIFILVFILASCKVSDSKNKEEPLSYYIPTIETTTLPYKVVNNMVELSTISFKIPQNFELKSDNGDLLLKSSENTVEISVEDITDSTTDFNKYIQDDIESLKQMGLSPSEIKETSVKNYNAKAFTVNTFDITSADIKIYCYYVEMGRSKIVVNVISKDSEIATYDQAEELLDKIEFTEKL